MALTVSTGINGVLEAGNNYSFTETFSQFPSPQYAMNFVMQLPGQAPINTPGLNYTDNVSFQINLGLSNTTNAGRYNYAEYVTDGQGNRQTAKTGVVQVIPSLTQQQALTDAQVMLATIVTAINNLLTGGFQSVSVNNISYTRAEISTLIAMRTRLQAEVKREQDAAAAFRGLETSGRIGTRFRPQAAGTPFFSKDIGGS